MEMVARVRLVIDVPFKFKVEDPDHTGHSESRVEAAKHAEDVLVKNMRTALDKKNVTFVSELVEEVREA